MRVGTAASAIGCLLHAIIHAAPPATDLLTGVASGGVGEWSAQEGSASVDFLDTPRPAYVFRHVLGHARGRSLWELPVAANLAGHRWILLEVALSAPARLDFYLRSGRGYFNKSVGLSAGTQTVWLDTRSFSQWNQPVGWGRIEAIRPTFYDTANQRPVTLKLFRAEARSEQRPAAESGVFLAREEGTSIIQAPLLSVQIPVGPGPHTKAAAELLRDGFHKLTAATLEIDESGQRDTANAIVIGRRALETGLVTETERKTAVRRPESVCQERLDCSGNPGQQGVLPPGTKHVHCPEPGRHRPDL